MTFIEKTFAIEVAMDDLDIENFKSLNATTAFVLKRTDAEWLRADRLYGTATD